MKKKITIIAVLFLILYLAFPSIIGVGVLKDIINKFSPEQKYIIKKIFISLQKT